MSLNPKHNYKVFYVTLSMCRYLQLVLVRVIIFVLEGRRLLVLYYFKTISLNLENPICKLCPFHHWSWISDLTSWSNKQFFYWNIFWYQLCSICEPSGEIGNTSIVLLAHFCLIDHNKHTVCVLDIEWYLTGLGQPGQFIETCGI
jgi:hypothetical protein